MIERSIMELTMTSSAAAVSNSHASARLTQVLLRFLAVAALTTTIAVTSSTCRLLLSSCPSLPQRPETSGRAKCVMFNFGDSNSDTGGLAAGAGFRLRRPVGRRFFGRPSGRFCDGRLYIDFICERLGIGHLSPYLESSGVSFRHGANFAAAGAATATQSRDAGLFSLPTQVRQFRHFKARTADLLPLGLGSRITDEEFKNAVYSFDIGQNDISLALSANLTDERILHNILPGIVTRIRNAVKTVYETGGRKFVLYNRGPFGCLPSTLAWWGRRGGGELDSAGYLLRQDGVARAFNALLRRFRHDLAAKLPGATVVGVDMYAIKYGLFANHTAHGFSNPLMACCGGGGPPYNYEPGTACGSGKVKACSESDGAKYISWDGLHYTEAANEVVAGKILSSEHNSPRLPLQTLCESTATR